VGARGRRCGCWGAEGVCVKGGGGGGGASVQSTTGSQGVRISGSNAGYTMF